MSTQPPHAMEQPMNTFDISVNNQQLALIDAHVQAHDLASRDALAARAIAEATPAGPHPVYHRPGREVPSQSERRVLEDAHHQARDGQGSRGPCRLTPAGRADRGRAVRGLQRLRPGQLAREHAPRSDSEPPREEPARRGPGVVPGAVGAPDAGDPARHGSDGHPRPILLCAPVLEALRAAPAHELPADPDRGAARVRHPALRRPRVAQPVHVRRSGRDRRAGHPAELRRLG